MDNPNWSSIDLDTAMGILAAYKADAQQTGDYEKVLDWTSLIQEHGTSAGQLVQSFAKYSRTPEGKSLKFGQAVKDLNKQYQKQIDGGMKPIEVDPRLIQQLLDATAPGDVKAAEEALAKDIARQVPATIADQIMAWRYLSMLANPRTHIRNVMGNLIMAGARKAKDAVGVGLEHVFITDQAERTKAFLGEDTQELKGYAASTWTEAEPLLEGGKFGAEDTVSDLIQKYRSRFKFKPLEALRKFNMSALEWEDIALFAKPAYENAYAMAMKAKGITADTITSEQRKEIMQLSMNEAMRATFRDASKLADSLSKLEKSHVAWHLVIGGTMPFKKTPINVLKRGVDYSPMSRASDLGDKNSISSAETSSAKRAAPSLAV